jgi:hypothetical protein
MFRKLVLTVGKKVEGTSGNEVVEVGKVDVFYPDLAEFGIVAAIKKDDNGAEVTDDDGVIVYADDKHDYAQYAIVQAVKMAARNKLIPGTIELRPGATISSNWEQLLAEGGNRGEALKLIAEVKKAFAVYVMGLEKKPEVKAAYISLFGNKQGLALQPKAIKDKFLNAVLEFAATLETEVLVRYERYIHSLEETCKIAEVSLD